MRAEIMWRGEVLRKTCDLGRCSCWEKADSGGGGAWERLQEKDVVGRCKVDRLVRWRGNYKAVVAQQA